MGFSAVPAVMIPVIRRCCAGFRIPWSLWLGTSVCITVISSGGLEVVFTV
ncbi:hypothetical protein [Mangrovimonas aestuarii]|nr:hypothetical protein [Mangrovimonas aestuarii]